MSKFNRAVLLLVFTAGYASAQDAKTTGQCSPIVQTSGGVSNVTIECAQNLTDEQIAKNNLSEMVKLLRSLLFTQSSYFMMSLLRYHDHPTPENWNLVIDDVRRTQKALDATIDGSIKYFGTIEYGDKRGPEIATLLSSRTEMLSQIGGIAASIDSSTVNLKSASASVTAPASMSPEQLDQWMTRYRALMKQLLDVTLALQSDLGKIQSAAKPN
jgi:hypothetical protein